MLTSLKNITGGTCLVAGSFFDFLLLLAIRHLFDGVVMLKIVALITALALTGCSNSPYVENFPNVSICLLASCSIQSRDAAGAGPVDASGPNSEVATDTADPTLSLPGGL